MSASDDSPYKPPIQPRSSMTRKSDNEESEDEGKPTLARRASSSKMPSRQERIVQALNKLDQDKLQVLTTRIGPDELAVALLDADSQTKAKIAACLPPDKLEVFKQYIAMGKDKLPSSVIDGVQGKLLRLT